MEVLKTVGQVVVHQVAAKGFQVGKKGVKAAKGAKGAAKGLKKVQKGAKAVGETAKVASNVEDGIRLQQFASEIVEMNKKTEGMGQLFAGKDVKSILNSASYYSRTSEQGAAIFKGIIKNHTFIDGNHRTAVNTFKRFAQQHNLKLNLSDQQLLAIAKKVESNSLVDVVKIASELTK